MLRFQERMKCHCDVLYEEGVRWFGTIDMEGQRKSMDVSRDRRAKRIACLVVERRELRKKLRKAETETVQDGFKALIKVLNEKFQN